MRRGLAFALVALVALVAVGCTESIAAPERTSGASGATATSGAMAATGPSGATGPDAGLPDPEQRIPLAAGRLARVFEENHAAERDAIAAWTSSGGSSTWPVADDVVLLTLYEQRIYRTLAARKDLARRVLRRLDGPIAREARSTFTAGRALYEHFAPLKDLPDLRIRAPEAADALLSYLREGQERFGVAWQVLAAVMLVETRMGRVRSNSSAGAQGPMQFLPSTWDAYGLGGDIRDPHDAILGAANYLGAAGAPEDYRAALYAYNPVKAYVIAVWSYARVMMRDPNAYYAFYDWQVFVRMRRGDVRLSGPGWPV